MQDTPFSSAWVRWPVTVMSFLTDALGNAAKVYAALKPEIVKAWQ